MYQYLGSDASTSACLNALMLVLQSQDRPGRAILLSSKPHSDDSQLHALLLRFDPGPDTFIKPGFSSGYRGEGPTGLSLALSLLQFHDYELAATICDHSFLKRVTNCTFRPRDMDTLLVMPASGWQSVQRYILEVHDKAAAADTLWTGHPIYLPLPLMDPRLLDLARHFWRDTDRALTVGYKRLEDIVRSRTQLRGFGVALMKRAFHGPTSVLTWAGKQQSEADGLAQLYCGAFAAYRNPRAHRVLATSQADLVTEFLQMNSLFRHESKAVLRSAI